MAGNEFQSIKDQLVEQKITKQVTITAGSTTTTAISIPRDKKVFLKGYGYSWFSTNEFTLSTGNRQFPTGSDQQGSPSIPIIFGNPFPCRAGGKLQLTIKNGDASDHTYDIVFYILTNDHLDEVSTGSELIIATGSGASSGGNVAIFDNTYTTSAGVTADGLEVHIDKALPAGTNNIGDVDIISMPNPTSPTVLLSGTKTAGTSGSALAGSASCKKIKIKTLITAPSDANGYAIWIGNATSQDYPLFAGESTEIEIANLSTLFVKRAGSTDVTVYYSAS